MKTEKININKNKVIILLYCLIVLLITLGFNHIYGSHIDWISQHSTFPEYFRLLFYKTGRLLPNFAFNIGGGQNIFNFSYYGLLNPIILISYLFPFIAMKDYIILASILLYILCGLFSFDFFKHHTNEKNALFLSLIFVSLSPLTYQFHHHIMFVWYFPFLILAFSGTDIYFEKNNSKLLVISLFLVIMTNYYFSVGALLAIFIYGNYLILQKEKTIKQNLSLEIKFLLRIFLPILMASIILLPNIFIILESKRASSHSIPLSKLLLPNLSKVVYNAYSPGISVAFLFFLILFFFSKNKANKFLAISLSLLTFIPFFMYALNGFLYIRGKSLIPCILLYFIPLIYFLNNWEKKFLCTPKKIIYISIFLIIFLTLPLLFPKFSLKKLSYVLFILLDLFALRYAFYFQKNKNSSYPIVLSYILVVSLVSTIFCTFNENYVTFKEYKQIQDPSKSELMAKIKDNTFYRTNIFSEYSDDINRIYNINQNITSIYSSTFNNDYLQFCDHIGNNIPYRNNIMTGDANNIFFNHLMGVRYIISELDLPQYKKIASENKQNLYFNKQALPTIYFSNQLGNYKEYKNLTFPYNLDYMLNQSIVENGNKKYKSHIKKYNLHAKEKYKFTIKEEKNFFYKLKEDVKNNFLILSFKMKKSNDCSLGDSYITINGIKNKLTCKGHLYPNRNYTFKYVIPTPKDNTLSITIGPGTYSIEDVQGFLIPNQILNIQKLDTLHLDRANSSITGKITNNKDGYIITSIPYENHFTSYIDGEKVKTERVNESFIGFPLKKGKHTIKIIYESPGYKIGFILSFLGFLLLGFLSIKKRCSK